MKNIYRDTLLENNNIYRRRPVWASAVSLLTLFFFMTTGAWAEKVPNSAETRKTVEAIISFDTHNLTCTGPGAKIQLLGAARIDGAVNPEGTLFSWTGPDDFTSQEQYIVATVHGTYTLTVTDPADGATDSRSVVIYAPVYPKGSAGPDKVLSAQTGTVTLSGDFSTPDYGLWVASDGGHIVSGERTPNPVVDAPGTYTLTITSSMTGCTIQDAVVVTGGSTAVDANAGPDKLLSCLTMTVQLEGSSSTPGATFSWTSSGEGFIRSGANTATPVVSGTGVYTLTVTANGVSTSDQVLVYDPNVAVLSSDGTYLINCSRLSIGLYGETNLEAGEYSWTGPDGFTASGRSITVTRGGDYALTVSSPSYDCTVTTTVTVQEFTQAPGASAGSDQTLARDGAAVTLQGSTPSTKEMLDFQWYDSQGERILVGLDGRNVTVSSPGIYTLQVVDPLNGCISTDQVSVLPADAQTEVTHHVIDFNSEQTGLISSVNTVLGSVSILGRKRNKENAFSYVSGNHAAIFDSQAPTGDDTDLYTTDWGNVLIVNQDLTDVPNDNEWGGELTLDFTAIGPVTMTSLKALDIDSYEGMSWVYLYGPGGKELYRVQLQNLGDNSKQMVDLGNTKGVTMMKIMLDGRNASGQLAGSGAIDDISFFVEDTSNDPCGTTPLGSAGPDQVLACRTSVVLDGTSNGEYRYMWTASDGGHIFAGENTLRPVVDAAGTYTLRITDPSTQCFTEDVVVVTLEQITVDANAGPDKALTCARTTVQLEGSTATEGATYQWTAADGGRIVSGGNTLNPTVDAAGTYTLIVTGRGRCFAMDKVVVTQHSDMPAVTVQASGFVIKCYPGEESIEISATTDVAGATYSWTGPIGFTSSERSFTVTGGVGIPSVEGTYTVTVTDPVTGCQATASTLISDITRDYTASAGPDKALSCQNPTVRLEGTYDGGHFGDGVTQFAWVASDGGRIELDENKPNPLVSAPGTYTLTVTYHGTGCTYTDVVVVTGDPACQGTDVANVQNATAYPNPIAEKGTVEFTQRKEGSYTVNLYDQRGSLVKELQAGTARAGEKVQVQVDGSQLREGLYFARIVSGSGSTTVKLLFKK